MAAPLSRTVLVATVLGLTANAYYSSGSLALSYLAIPAILIPKDAPLMPPEELSKPKKYRTVDISTAPTQPLDSGEGDASERVRDVGAIHKINKSSPASTGHLMRQWFHVYAKGLYTYPPFALGAAASYFYCAYILPGRGLDFDTQFVITRRGLYAVSTMLSAGVILFTWTGLRSTNQALQERTEVILQKESMGTKFEAGEIERVETETLIRRWGAMNAWRAIVPFLASVTATLALVI